MLDEAGIPCAPVNTIDRVFHDPQTAAREMLIDVPHPTIGPLKMAGTPLKFASLAPPPRRLRRFWESTPTTSCPRS